MFTAKQAKRIYRDTCTYKVGRTDSDGQLVVERIRKSGKPSFKTWLRAFVTNSQHTFATHDTVRTLSPKLHRIVFGGA